MDGGAIPTAVALEAADLGRLMPMHLHLSPSGHILAAGPTLTRLCCGVGPAGAATPGHAAGGDSGPAPVNAPMIAPGHDHPGAGSILGLRFLELFAISKPQRVEGMAALGRLGGQRLHLLLRRPPHTALRGIAVPLAGGAGMIVNLSFGIAAAEAVRKHALTHADFAPTDLTVELLYLTEVKAAVMAELAALNLRLREARAAAETQALSDALTGLANRRALDLALAQAAAAAAGGGAGFALLHLDLDLFKAVNDSHGHAAGDRVLIHVATVLQCVLRRNDVAARVGGDEFVLILRAMTDREAIAQLAARLIAGIEAPVPFEGVVCRVSASIGVTLSGFYDRPDPDRMLSDADSALYASKRQGRARCSFHAPGRQPPEDRRKPSAG